MRAYRLRLFFGEQDMLRDKDVVLDFGVACHGGGWLERTGGDLNPRPLGVFALAWLKAKCSSQAELPAQRPRRESNPRHGLSLGQMRS